MREILFRGKMMHNDRWIHGGFHSRFERAFIIGISKRLRIDGIEVYPETVGQYTGLTDKNGKKIFEGDILSYTEEIETRSKGKETLKGIYEVKFEYCGFSPLDCLACNHLEIIGNIHDDPELLKGGAEG